MVSFYYFDWRLLPFAAIFWTSLHRKHCSIITLYHPSYQFFICSEYSIAWNLKYIRFFVRYFQTNNPVIPKLCRDLFPFQTQKFSFSKLSKFSFLNCQNFSFQTVKIFLFQTVKISLFKLSKFSFSNCQNFPFQAVNIFLFKLSTFSFSNCQTFHFQTVRSLHSNEYEETAWCVAKFLILILCVAAQKVWETLEIN